MFVTEFNDSNFLYSECAFLYRPKSDTVDVFEERQMCCRRPLFESIEYSTIEECRFLYCSMAMVRIEL